MRVSENTITLDNGDTAVVGIIDFKLGHAEASLQLESTRSSSQCIIRLIPVHTGNYPGLQWEVWYTREMLVHLKAYLHQEVRRHLRQASIPPDEAYPVPFGGSNWPFRFTIAMSQDEITEVLRLIEAMLSYMGKTPRIIVPR